MLREDLQVKYKVKIIEKDEREKVIRSHISKWKKSEHSHENEFYVKGKFIKCPIINLPIELPVYHLNNGRTQSMQSEYIFEKKESDGFFSNNLENSTRQKIQHGLLVQQAQGYGSHKENIFDELKKRKAFREDQPILVDIKGMVINGNRRLSSVRELYETDKKAFSKFQVIPTAVIQEHLTLIDIEEIESYYQIKRELKQDYDWISLIKKIQRQKDVLKKDFKWISVTMDKSVDWVESSYKLIEEIDTCLEEDYNKPKNYNLIMNQFQIWEETRKKAYKTKDAVERDLIFKIARIVSLNSRDLGKRAYEFFKDFTNKRNLKEVHDYLKLRFHLKASIANKTKKSDNPEDNLPDQPTQFEIGVIDKIKPSKVKADVVLELQEELDFKSEDAAALKVSKDILNKMIKLESASLPPENRSEILSNMKKINKKSTTLINKLDKK
ncbi:hypothetical protein N8934_02330 [Candidatus Pelagibacter sp.]|nr:hypothetical protein [Candidatus Pelagibacter sp.]